MSDQETPRESIELPCTFELAEANSMCLRTHLGSAEGTDEHEGREFHISMSGGALVVEEKGGRYVSISLSNILNQGVRAMDCLSMVETLLAQHGNDLEGREAEVDELIHDAVSHEGSAVNNAGLKTQLIFLAEQVGPVEAERLVRTTFELAGT